MGYIIKAVSCIILRKPMGNLQACVQIAYGISFTKLHMSALLFWSPMQSKYLDAIILEVKIMPGVLVPVGVTLCYNYSDVAPQWSMKEENMKIILNEMMCLLAAQAIRSEGHMRLPTQSAGFFFSSVTAIATQKLLLGFP